MKEPSEFSSIDDVDPFISKKIGEILDANHRLVKMSRGTIDKLTEFHSRFNSVIGQLVEAHVAATLMINELSGDILMAEFGVDEVIELDLEEDEDEEDEDE